MKNISLSLTPFGGLQPIPITPPSFQTKPTNTNYSFSLVTQFETEEEALIFTGFILAKLNEYKDNMKEI